MSHRTRTTQTKRTKTEPLWLLSSKREPLFTATFIPEPGLEFGLRQQLVDPRVGLGIHGPVDRTSTRTAPIRLGLIGTGPLIDKVRRWLARCQGEVEPIRRSVLRGQVVTRRTDPAVVPKFPGIRAVFATDFVLNDQLVETLSSAELEEIRRIEVYEPRVTRLAEIIGKRLSVIADKTTVPDVVLVALPSELRKLCTTPTKHKRRGRRPRTLADILRASLEKDEAKGQLNLLDVAAANRVSLDEDDDHENVVLHSAVKIHGMRADLPTQLLWEGTLDGIGVEDDATCAWNICSGIYYKANNELWRLTGLTENSCFVGLSFYKDRHDENLRCCVAQAFSDRGEGLVIRSDPFTWNSEHEKTPHLPREMAAAMLRKVLETYYEHLKVQPSRVVIHKWQRFWPDERAGFEDALKSAGVHSEDFVSFGSRGLRFYRAGSEPPIRGTYIALGEGEGLLYTRGYVPFLRRYPGMRVPRPLEILEHHGSASMTQVAQEILALTKLDWNTTMFAGKEPITTAFAWEVGQILSELPPNTEPKRSYRFYM